MSSRQPPMYCPFCADQDLHPGTAEATAWECRSCARVFTVHMLGLSGPDSRADRSGVRS